MSVLNCVEDFATCGTVLIRMRKIACVEDSREYQLLIQDALKGYEVQFVSTLAQARTLFQNETDGFEMLLLDVSLPDGNGIKFLSEIKLTRDLPVFILTADNDVLSKVAAFGIGADDYIVKPFHALELRARVEAKMRSHQTARESGGAITVGDLAIDAGKMSVTGDKGQRIDLTPIEFKILHLLARRIGNVYSRAQIMTEVWGDQTHLTDRTVDAHVSHLRKKIAFSRVKITTVLSVGYKISVRA